MVFSKLFGKSDTIESAHSLYSTIVEQARQPVFYTDLQVADTVDGRFDMVTLHAYLLFRRLKDDQERTAELSQATFDVMFDNFDENLRELGVGDIGIGKRIKKMASAFFGRVTAYDEGLAETDNEKLIKALERNLYKEVAVKPENLEAMAEYLRSQVTVLNDQAIETLVSGKVSFGSVK
ncbi:MAG: hypothetical protein OQK35_02340 [Alphaproteobacteria bacterium]|nr:hypothetical protein [Rhodospirillales bacterium]MCW9045147.1 hypothetical protein [Alphaproteobacteria bacterium]